MQSMKSMLQATVVLLGALAAPLAWAGDTPAACQPQTAYTVTGSDLTAIATRLEADPALAEGQCVALTAAESKSPAASYSCAKPSEKTDAAFRGVLSEAGASLNSVTATCPTNCVLTYCPYPTVRCCNIYTHQPCL